MEHQKLLNLLNKASNSTFTTRKWNIINDHSKANYQVGNKISIILRLRKLRLEINDHNGSLDPKGNAGRSYLAKKEGGRGLTSCEECVNVKVQSLDKYLSESEKWMLKFVAGEKGLSEVEDPNAFKNRFKKEKRSQWLEKPLRGRFLKDTEKGSIGRT